MSDPIYFSDDNAQDEPDIDVDFVTSLTVVFGQFMEEWESEEHLNQPTLLDFMNWTVELSERLDPDQPQA